MDTFEENENNAAASEAENPVTPPSADAPQAEAEAPVQPQDTSPADNVSYQGSRTERKESPYANSPYIMNPQPQTDNNRYQYQPQPEKPQKPRQKRRKHSAWKGVVAALLTVALVAGGCLITAASVNRHWEERSQQTYEQLSRKIDDLQQQIDAASNRNTGNSVSGSPVATGGGLTPSQVYAQNVDSVVAISSTYHGTAFGQITEGSSSGSGFILTEDGYVVTNYHVIEDADVTSVITNEGTEYPAQIVGYDATNDLAVLKVEAEGLPAVTLGSSSDLIVGDMVVAIGNPLGELTATQTVGYVSGKDREVTTDGTILNMIQTDAAINPGNSGGPLFNMKGEVVGITTAKYSGTTSSGASIEGLGFAIPIDDVLRIISDLKEFGYVTGAYLGVTVQNTDAASASMFGLPTGAYVVSVVEGGSAHRAGIQPKDIIIDLGGYKVSNVTDLTRALRNFQAGDTTTVTLLRSGMQMELSITLDEKPRDLSTPTAPESDSGLPSEGSYDEWYEYFRRFFGDEGGD